MSTEIIINTRVTHTLKLEEIRAFLVDVRALCLEHLVETLTLQRAAGHREVHKRHTRTDIWRELYCGITCREEDDE